MKLTLNTAANAFSSSKVTYRLLYSEFSALYKGKGKKFHQSLHNSYVYSFCMNCVTSLICIDQYKIKSKLCLIYISLKGNQTLKWLNKSPLPESPNTTKCFKALSTI